MRAAWANLCSAACRQRALSSGHLLPRYDQNGEVDETDDVQLSSHRVLDFQINAKDLVRIGHSPFFGLCEGSSSSGRYFQREVRAEHRPSTSSHLCNEEIDEEIRNRLQTEMRKLESEDKKTPTNIKPGTMANIEREEASDPSGSIEDRLWRERDYF